MRCASLAVLLALTLALARVHAQPPCVPVGLFAVQEKCQARIDLTDLVTVPISSPPGSFDVFAPDGSLLAQGNLTVTLYPVDQLIGETLTANVTLASNGSSCVANIQLLFDPPSFTENGCADADVRIPENYVVDSCGQQTGPLSAFAYTANNPATVYFQSVAPHVQHVNATLGSALLVTTVQNITLVNGVPNSGAAVFYERRAELSCTTDTDGGPLFVLIRPGALVYSDRTTNISDGAPPAGLPLDACAGPSLLSADGYYVNLTDQQGVASDFETFTFQWNTTEVLLAPEPVSLALLGGASPNSTSIACTPLGNGTTVQLELVVHIDSACRFVWNAATGSAANFTYAVDIGNGTYAAECAVAAPYEESTEAVELACGPLPDAVQGENNVPVAITLRDSSGAVFGAGFFTLFDACTSAPSGPPLQCETAPQTVLAETGCLGTLELSDVLLAPMPFPPGAEFDVRDANGTFLGGSGGGPTATFGPLDQLIGTNVTATVFASGGRQCTTGPITVFYSAPFTADQCARFNLRIPTVDPSPIQCASPRSARPFQLDALDFETLNAYTDMFEYEVVVGAPLASTPFPGVVRIERNVTQVVNNTAQQPAGPVVPPFTAREQLSCTFLTSGIGELVLNGVPPLPAPIDARYFSSNSSTLFDGEPPAGIPLTLACPSLPPGQDQSSNGYFVALDNPAVNIVPSDAQQFSFAQLNREEFYSSFLVSAFVDGSNIQCAGALNVTVPLWLDSACRYAFDDDGTGLVTGELFVVDAGPPPTTPCTVLPYDFAAGRLTLHCANVPPAYTALQNAQAAVRVYVNSQLVLEAIYFVQPGCAATPFQLPPFMAEVGTSMVSCSEAQLALAESRTYANTLDAAQAPALGASGYFPVRSGALVQGAPLRVLYNATTQAITEACLHCVTENCTQCIVYPAGGGPGAFGGLQWMPASCQEFEVDEAGSVFVYYNRLLDQFTAADFITMNATVNQPNTLGIALFRAPVPGANSTCDFLNELQELFYQLAPDAATPATRCVQSVDVGMPGSFLFQCFNATVSRWECTDSACMSCVPGSNTTLPTFGCVPQNEFGISVLCNEAFEPPFDNSTTTEPPSPEATTEPPTAPENATTEPPTDEPTLPANTTEPPTDEPTGTTTPTPTPTPEEGTTEPPPTEEPTSSLPPPVDSQEPGDTTLITAVTVSVFGCVFLLLLCLALLALLANRSRRY